MGDSKIEYVTKTWNVVTGCTPVSEGCRACWAAAYHRRWKKDFAPTFHTERLAEPLHWRKSQRVAVAFLGDLFHHAITEEQVAAVFGVMAACRQHQFFVTTKRAGRMRAWFAGAERFDPGDGGGTGPARAIVEAVCNADAPFPESWDCEGGPPTGNEWPLPNVWPGASVENQPAADERLPELMATPAAHRWVSLEPCLGPVDLSRWLGEGTCREIDDHGEQCGVSAPLADMPRVNGARRCAACGSTDIEESRGLDWCVVGGESSQGGQPARPCDVAWIRAVVEQCRAAGVACYVKQLGSNIRDRNDVGFEAENEVFADGIDAGRPTEPQAWPTPVAVEYDVNGYREEYQGAPVRVRLRHPRGADPKEWPEDLRVRELPNGEEA